MAEIVGILNVTPDSFFLTSRQSSYDEAVARGVCLAEEGADWIDIGGESTRPGAMKVSAEEEIKRVIPVIEELKKHTSLPISIDTMKVEVAKLALESGASMINDISGFRCPRMRELAASKDVKLCAMHMLGLPDNMQNNPKYKNGIIDELLFWFEETVNQLIASGVKKEQIILDPGIGFGKTIADNFEILQNLPKLKAVGFPLLLGISRKSFMGKNPSELLPATLVLNAFAMPSVDYIRVHDVKEHRQALNVLQMVY